MGISETQCGLEEKVCVLETTIGCSTAGITRFSGREQWVWSGGDQWVCSRGDH